MAAMTRDWPLSSARPVAPALALASQASPRVARLTSGESASEMAGAMPDTNPWTSPQLSLRPVSSDPMTAWPLRTSSVRS